MHPRQSHASCSRMTWHSRRTAANQTGGAHGLVQPGAQQQHQQQRGGGDQVGERCVAPLRRLAPRRAHLATQQRAVGNVLACFLKNSGVATSAGKGCVPGKLLLNNLPGMCCDPAQPRPGHLAASVQCSRSDSFWNSPEGLRPGWAPAAAGPAGTPPGASPRLGCRSCGPRTPHALSRCGNAVGDAEADGM